MSEQTGLLVRSEQSFDDVERAAKAMVASGFFQDSKSISQAIVKILAGRELGFGPFASMTGVYIIQGRPSIGANLMASAVKGSGRYDYRVTENTDQACEITFFENGKEIGKSKFTNADAIKAGTKNLDKFPRNMLFARAMSNGVRWFTPDAFNGNAVYTPEELGADIDIEGNVIPGSFQEVEQPDTAVNTFAKESGAVVKEIDQDRKYKRLSAEVVKMVAAAKGLSTSDAAKAIEEMFKAGKIPAEGIMEVYEKAVKGETK